MASRIDLAGKKIGRLQIISSVDGTQKWTCLCDCGNYCEIRHDSLLRNTKSCGCLQKEAARKTRTSHGMFKHPGYQTWGLMKDRCLNARSKSYQWYGAIGVTVCDKWLEFNSFWGDMGPTWKEGLSIDRIDPNGDYDPANCRWATPKQQANNKRTNRMVTLPDGRIMNVTQAAEAMGISAPLLFSRLSKGWTGEKLFNPARPMKRK